ncbi:MAG TPA: PepSY domain-containing protein [Kofleriaceae bacterium]
MWRRVHRWLAIVLVIPLVIWSITGLLFHLKPGWSRAYDLLDAERPAQVHLDKLVLPEGVTHVEVFSTAIGPLARVTTPKGDELYDADTGTRRSPLPIDAAQALAVDAIARSHYASTYGATTRVTSTEATVTIELADGPVVEVGRNDGRLSQRGPDTDRIDWLYRIHYLQLTGNKTFDKILALAGLALIWLVLIPGVVLFVRRR